MISLLKKLFFPRRSEPAPAALPQHSEVIPFRPINNPIAHPPAETIHLRSTRGEQEIIKGRCWVIDGDTIVINKIHIRLAGIDAPELDQPFGKVAKSALVKFCRGQVVTAYTDGSFSHERTVARCYLPDGRDLSAEMVKAGLALDWKKYSNGRYRSLETPDLRRKLWRVDARQRGKMPPRTNVD